MISEKLGNTFRKWENMMKSKQIKIFSEQGYSSKIFLFRVLYLL